MDLLYAFKSFTSLLRISHSANLSLKIFVKLDHFGQISVSFSMPSRINSLKPFLWFVSVLMPFFKASRFKPSILA